MYEVGVDGELAFDEALIVRVEFTGMLTPPWTYQAWRDGRANPA